jgi:hypothetical protein
MKSKRGLPAIIFLLVFVGISSQAQHARNEGKIILASFSYGVDIPMADLASRFGINFAAGTALDIQTEHNFILGTQFRFLYGEKVKQDILAPLRNEDGLLFNDDLSISDIQPKQRGWSVSASIGKLIPASKKHPRSGIIVSLGAGFMEHKIFMQNELLTKISLLFGEYRKGYDRLTNGLMLSQYAGYQHLSANRRINFRIGTEIYENFSKNRRNFDFDSRKRDIKGRFDVLWGFKLAWTLPFYISENPDEIRY